MLATAEPGGYEIREGSAGRAKSAAVRRMTDEKKLKGVRKDSPGKNRGWTRGKKADAVRRP